MRVSVTISAVGAIFVICILLLAKLISEGGVDTITYQQVIYTSPVEWGAYYLSNAFSWAVVYTSFKLSEGYQVGVSLALIDLFVWICFFAFSKRDRDFNVYAAPLAMFSISGILLSHNVLRQYIAMVFILIVSIRFFQARRASVVPFAVLALLSHFSSAIFLFSLLLSRYTFKKKAVRMLLLPVIYLICTAFFMAVPPSAITSPQNLGDTTAELYAFFSLALSVLALFFIKSKLYSTGRTQTTAIEEASRFLVYSIATIFTISAAGPPVWFTNRFLVSFIFVASSYIFILTPGKRGRHGRLYSWIVNFTTIVLLIVTALFHPGAMSMIGL
jgi:hypothetical protein